MYPIPFGAEREREMDLCEVDISKFLMPWEHSVCSACLHRNSHSVWLVKCRCFEPQQHGRKEQTIVTIDHSCMEMVTIRPLPYNHQQFQGEFVECQHYPNCRHGTLCNFAHSKAECDTWNIKKRILKGGTVATEFKIKCTVRPLQIYTQRGWLAIHKCTVGYYDYHSTMQ